MTLSLSNLTPWLVFSLDLVLDQVPQNLQIVTGKKVSELNKYCSIYDIHDCHKLLNYIVWHPSHNPKKQKNIINLL